MKKFMVFAAMLLALSSCKKEMIERRIDDLSSTSYKTNTLRQPPRVPYAALFTNLCYPEAVEMSGTTTNSSASFTIKGIRYNILVIKYDRVSGLGMQSGLIYSGGGQFIDTTVIYPDNSSIESVSYDATYSTKNGNAIIFDEHSRFLYSPTGVMTIDYNHINNRCK